MTTIALSYMLTPFVGASATALLLGGIVCVEAPKHGFALAFLTSLTVVPGTWVGFQITLVSETGWNHIIAVFCLISFAAFWMRYRFILHREL